ncbi:MAG: hypothetical protein GY853_04780 [PVC group bacterium]|nr:hypothetical protein [PVC group bacterium]
MRYFIWTIMFLLAVSSVRADEVLIFDDNQYGIFTPSGMMGDDGDLQMKTLKINGKRLLNVTYVPQGIYGLGWAGIVFQYPANNWGQFKGTSLLQEMNKLTFWAKGKKGGEKITFIIGGMDQDYSDSGNIEREIRLNEKWKKYSIVPKGNLKHMIASFGVAVNALDNPEGCSFYLDQIYYEDSKGRKTEEIPRDFGSFAVKKEPGDVKYIYRDNICLRFSPCGVMPKTALVNIDTKFSDNPYAGKTCMKITALEDKSEWAGLYFLYPLNNWGDFKGRKDLKGMRKLVFWARGSGKVAFGIGGVNKGKYKDSGNGEIEVELSDDWVKYEIRVRKGNLSHMIGGYYFSAKKEGNPQGIELFLDEIRYE